MNEPEWIEHDGSADCPVPAGHDVEVRFTDQCTDRDREPEDWTWERRGYYITHYRDWTAWEQQQASAEVPETVTVPLSDWLAMFRRLGMAEGLLAGWLYAGRDTARAKAATEAFLAERTLTGSR